MRSFEEIPDIAERIKRSKMELQKSGFYWAPEWDSQSCCDQDYVNNFKEGWESRQTEVDELRAKFDQHDQWLGQRNRDVQELYDINVKHAAEKAELQKRVDKALQLLAENSIDFYEAFESGKNSRIVDADELEQALKGGGE